MRALNLAAGRPWQRAARRGGCAILPNLLCRACCKSRAAWASALQIIPCAFPLLPPLLFKPNGRFTSPSLYFANLRPQISNLKGASVKSLKPSTDKIVSATNVRFDAGRDTADTLRARSCSPAPGAVQPSASAPVVVGTTTASDSLGSLRRRFRGRTTSDAAHKDKRAAAPPATRSKHTFRATKLDWMAVTAADSPLPAPLALADSAALSASLSSLSSADESCDDSPSSAASSRAASPVAAAPLIDPAEYISVFSTTAV